MTCTACRASFDDSQNDSQRAAAIDATHPHCECQSVPVSDLSPGVVDDSELLVRILVSPIHIKGMKVKGSAFSRAETTGLSVVRDHYATDAVVLQVAQALVDSARQANGDKAGVVGVLLVKASAIRGVRADDEAPCYCVYDTAIVENVAHAEALQRVHGCEPDLILLRRSILQREVEHTFISATEYRNGLLSVLAPTQ